MDTKHQNELSFCIDKDNEEIVTLNVPQQVLDYWNTLAILLTPDFTHTKYLNLLLYRKNESGPAAQIIRCGSLRDIGEPSREVLGVQDEIIISKQNERGQVNFQFYTDTKTFKTFPEFLEENEYVQAFLDIANELVLIPGSSIIIKGFRTVFVSDGKVWIKGDGYEDAVQKAHESKKSLKKLDKKKRKKLHM